ncbi:hypothetical protein HDU76_005209 [Blyttiomyces sp. JEL0837]|nr:hypothetical protein HDU76_005209 [Blyttiomyces sp. JEL0837]
MIAGAVNMAGVEATNTLANLTPKKRTNVEVNGTLAEDPQHKKARTSVTPSAAASSSSKSQQPSSLPTATTLMWFRMDFRIQDNTALYNAHMNATVSKRPLVALYVVSPAEWLEHDVSAVRVNFWLRNLELLKVELEARGIPLIVVNAERRKDVPGVVAKVVRDVSAKAVFWNMEYEVNEQLRDKKVHELITVAGVDAHGYHDQCIVQPCLVRTKEGNRVYTVFTPFKKAWIALLYKEKRWTTLSPTIPIPSTPPTLPSNLRKVVTSLTQPIPKSVKTHPIEDSNLLLSVTTNFPAGEISAHERLNKFCAEKIAKYKESRDVPSLQGGTSSLSAYLAAGVVSARQCIVKALEMNKGKFDSGSEGVVTWISELAWRDFYKNILLEFPRVCKNKPFKIETDLVPWAYDEEKFKRWCEGKTGYPIVDAGMRQLKTTGWMHNRVRMITAMFLSKDLGLDWRRGERWFMQNLIDGDFSANNGGWQWAAGTGTDAQPYFRVFNPLLQSEKFDPDGHYIRKYVPELAKLRGKDIHSPPKNQLKSLRYPAPIVDHKVASKAFVEAFKLAVMKK